MLNNKGLSQIGTELQFLDLIIIRVSMAMGEDDIGRNVSQNGTDERAHKTGSSENSGSDTRNIVSSSLIINKESGSLCEGSHQGRVEEVGGLGFK